MSKTKEADKAQARMLVARARADAATERARDLYFGYQAAARVYLKAEGWIEESRYDGPRSWERVYRRPTGSRWHTMRGALEQQKRLDRASTLAAKRKRAEQEIIR